MRTWSTEAWLPAAPLEVLDLLREPEAIARWSPIEFELLEIDGHRLDAGTRARVRGSLAGHGVVFDVRVDQANLGGLSLCATGPVEIHARYALTEERCGSRVLAAVGVTGRGWAGRLLAHATEALLRGGALRMSLMRIGQELERPAELAYA